jgi:hypothetical protein
MKRIYFCTLAIAVFILTACVPAATSPDDSALDSPVSSDDPTPAQSGSYLPSPADSNLKREVVYLDSTEMTTLEIYPPKFMLALTGNLPTPCHQLRISASPPDAQNKVAVDVYSVVDPTAACAEMLQPFEVNFSLGSFPTGHYTLWVNGERIADFDA